MQTSHHDFHRDPQKRPKVFNFNMLFQSRLPKPSLPDSTVYHYLLHQGRRDYPRDRILYRQDGSDRTLTLAELEEQSTALAKVLIGLYSIQPGDVVAIFASDTIHFPVAYMAMLAAGATVSLIPVQQNISPENIADRLSQSQARLLFTDELLLSTVHTFLANNPDFPLILLDEASAKYPCLVDLLKQCETSTPLFHFQGVDEANKHIAFINSTSGSTGKMKSVLTSHSHFTSTMEGTRATIPTNTDPDADTWVSTLSLGYYICAKLFMGLNILLGIPVVLLNRPLGNDDESLSVIERHKLTFLFIAPPVAAEIAKADTAKHDLTSIKWLLSAGAPMHDKLRESISQQLNNQHLTLEWGTTETMLLAIQIDEQSSIPGSSGTLVNGIEAKVIDTETGAELGPGQEGEILVRNSCSPYAGYRDNDEANKAFDADGFFHTGDIGFLDSTCNVFIKDRMQELLRVGNGYGSRISASELESVLFDHPAVAMAVVVGVRDEVTQIFHPTAFVVLASGCTAGYDMERELVEYSERQLTGLKRLTGGVYFLRDYPKIGFKIDRKKLKTLVQIASGQATREAINGFVALAA
ncbi:hypothetical protein NLG97_g5443 [Lecanicillium saksenae]|uniref:Uncharacterized protein n=1 Tax=Lecanicillium saksenae TaxID=468837 RepID=A0ACC1QU66_9HYPO|nr:hypothetical protein NLG97_g5443 [Lecanicillium saksenae]